MENNKHLTLEELEKGLDFIYKSPSDNGVLEMIVCRPKSGERERLKSANLSVDEGLQGDNWYIRGSSRTKDGSSHPDMQLNLMNSRVISLIACKKSRWQLAGDQMFVDLDLRPKNMTPGTRLAVGKAIIEITDQPHTGCKKFIERFGRDAMKFISTKSGRENNLRGVNAKVIKSGVICEGDRIKVINN